MIKDEYIVLRREDLNRGSQNKTFNEIQFYDFTNVLDYDFYKKISMIIFSDLDIKKYKILKSRYFEL